MNSVERLVSDLPLRDAAEVVAEVADDATLLVSGFGSVGYQKTVPLAFVPSDRDLSLTVVSGGSVGNEIDAELVEADAIARRYPYQASPPAREAVNARNIDFHDRNISTLGDEIQYSALADGSVAVVEALAVGPGWLIQTTSIGHMPAIVESADRLVVELNRSVLTAVRTFHDIYRPEKPLNCDPISLSDPGDRIGSDRIDFDSDKLIGVVETERRDQPYEFRDRTDADRAIALNLRAFLEAEVRRSPLVKESLRNSVRRRQPRKRADERIRAGGFR